MELSFGKFQKLLFCPMDALFVGWQIALQFSKHLGAAE